MDYQINFPHLGIHLEHVIKNFSIGGLTIAIYGIMVTAGLLLGLYLTRLRAKETGQDPETYLDLFLLLVITGFLGARLYYVAFTWDYYKAHPLQILNFRGGGIAFYGGLIAGTIALIVFSKRRNLHFLRVLDTVIMGVCAGQIVGRWGNFFNREAFGQYTDGLFAMQLPVSAVRQNEITQEMWDHLVTISGVDFIQVHPTFLYEGLWNLGLLILLFVFRNKVKFYGETFFRYLLGYGIGRFWIESLRTDQLKLPVIHVPVSMVVAVLTAVIGLVGIIMGRSYTARKKARHVARALKPHNKEDDELEQIEEWLEEQLENNISGKE